MKLISVDPSELIFSEELQRSGSAKQFEDRLRASIAQVGLAEPIKVARVPTGGYLIIDGAMRVRAINKLREATGGGEHFSRIPAYLMSYDERFEIRFQTDIYQDLLPSQLAGLVEHLHKSEKIRKADLAKYVGVSPATLRNYTGVWRLIQRGGVFARVVDLMDARVMPSSNPYAWLRLTDVGLQHVLGTFFASGPDVQHWVGGLVRAARLGGTTRFTVEQVEAATGALPAEMYRETEGIRAVKKDLGLRRATSRPRKEEAQSRRDDATRHLATVRRETRDPVLRIAAESLEEFFG